MVSGRKMSLALANIVVGTVLGLLANRVIAIYWGASLAGQFTAAMAFVGLAFFVTDLGMGLAHVKRVSEGRHAGDCFATFAVFKVVSTAAFVVLVLLGLWGYTSVLGRTIEDTTLPVITLVLGYYVAKSLQEIGQSSFEARLETAKMQLASFADTVVRVGLTLAFGALVAALLHSSGPLAGRIDPANPVLAWIHREPAAALAAAQMAGSIAAAIIALLLLRRIMEHGRFRWTLLKDYWTFALPIFLTSAITSITIHVDSAVIAQFLTSFEVGIWGRVKVVVQVLAGISPLVAALLFPAISGLAARGGHDEIAAKMDRAVRYMSMLLAPAVLFTVFFSPSIIRLTLSEEFLGGSLAMSVLVVNVYFMTIATPHANLIMGMGRPKIIATIGVTITIVVVILNLVLVPTDIRSLGIRLAGLGILGAAIASVVSAVLFYALCRYASWRVSGYRERAATWKHLLAGAIMSLALLAIEQYAFGLDRWYQFPIYMAAGGAMYLAALVALREFTNEDLAFVSDSVHPVEMLRYVRAELFHRKK